MNKLTFMLALAATCMLPGSASTNVTEVVDEYRFVMTLKVPRTYDNMQSQGYRKYQTQKVEGTMYIVYSSNGTGAGTYIELKNLVNKTHKVSGSYVKYTTMVDGVKIGYIGSNKTDMFKTPFLSFAMDADPSYNVGADEPDNTLVLEVSGYGTSKTMTWSGYKNVRYISKLTGRCAGNLGCGCTAYGHKSCTRTAAWYGATDEVTDIAAIGAGTWTAKWKRRFTRCGPTD